MVGNDILLTTTEYGAKYGVKDCTVRKWISRGIVNSVKIGISNYILSTDEPRKKPHRGPESESWKCYILDKNGKKRKTNSQFFVTQT